MAFLALGGCAETATRTDANYAAYLQLVKDQAAQADQQRAAFAQMAQKCSSDACVSQVAAIAALAGASGHAQAPPQQYVPRESTAAKFGLALVSQLSPLAATAVNWHSASINRDISLAQYSFLGGTIHDLSGTAASLGQAAAGMTPSINVGHDYVSGSVDNGTHIGGDSVGRDKIGGDNVGHDKIDNSGVLNYGTIDRYQSPGPYDDHSAAGSGCTGSTTCQNQPITTPIPPPSHP